MGKATGSFSAEDIYVSCLEGYYEGLNAGVTSYVEHASNNWRREVVEPGYSAACDSGARVWWCYDLSPRDGFSSEQQLSMLREIKKDVNAAEAPVSMGLAFDGFNLAKEPDVKHLKEIVRYAKTMNAFQARADLVLEISVPR